MKCFLILIMSFALSQAHAQFFLHNEDGVKLSYTTIVVKTVFCDNEKKNVYFIKVRWTLSNNSGKPLYINASCYLQLGAPGCLSQDEVARYGYQPLRTNFDGTLESGDDVLGEDGSWFYERDITPYWTLTTKPLWDRPKNSGTKEKVPNPVKKKAQPTFGVSQTGDVINNPTTPVVPTKQRNAEADAIVTRERVLQKEKQQNEDAIKLQAEQNIQEDLRLARERKNDALRNQLAQSQQAFENKIEANNRFTTELSNSLTSLVDNIYGIIERNKSKRAEVFEGFVSDYVNNQYEKKSQIDYYEERDLTPELEQLPLEKLRAKSSISAELQESDVSPNIDLIVSSLKLAISKGDLIEIIPDGIKRSIRLNYKLMTISYSKDYLSLLTNMFFKAVKKDGSRDTEGNFETVWNNTVFKFEDITDIKFFPESVKYVNGAKIIEFAHYEILLKTGESYPFIGSSNASDEVPELKKYLADFKKASNAEEEEKNKNSPEGIASRNQMIQNKLAHLKDEYANVLLLDQKTDLQKHDLKGKVRRYQYTYYNVKSSTSGEPLLEKFFSKNFKYNENGFLISEIDYLYTDLKIDVEMINFEYNKYNTVLLAYDPTSNMIVQEFTYNKLLDGGYQKKQIWHFDGQDIFHISDNSNVKLSYSLTYHDTVKLSSKTTYFYSKTNQLLSTASIGYETSTTLCSYNTKGKLIKEVTKNSNNQIIKVSEIKYDPQGKLLETIFTDKGKTSKYVHEKWDSHGNCILSKTYSDGVVTSVIEGEYEYY